VAAVRDRVVPQNAHLVPQQSHTQVLAWCCGRGPLAMRLQRDQFIGVMIIPVIPWVGGWRMHHRCSPAEIWSSF
jgi:hypothetical protein